MAVPTPKKIDIPHEVNVVKKNTELPITGLVFDKTHAFVNLFVNNINVGTLGYDIGPMIFYHKLEEKSIKWADIYIQYKEIINHKIFDLEPLAKQITVGIFKHLYVKDEAGEMLFVAYCTYRDDEWVIVNKGKN